jgi:putative ubiquitin-RnfH superfamily antitoxin RatB of RatAB toxin-antitoxin module
MADPIQIEIAYAKPARQELVKLKLPAGSTVQQAIEASGLLARYPEIDLAQAKVGIYGKLARLDTALREKDRVEIYRPLIADPKEVRKARAAEGKLMKKGGGTAEE